MSSRDASRCAFLLCVFVYSLTLDVTRAQVEYVPEENVIVFSNDWMDEYNPWDDPLCPNFTPWDGCGRTPARPKPTAAPNGRDKTTRKPWGGPPTTPIPNPYELVCSEDEIKEAGCLNGAECYALELVDVRTAHCRCQYMWTGIRCERLDEKIFVLPANKAKLAGIATGVSALVIVLAVIIAYILILRRLRYKRRQETAQNGYVCKPFIPQGTNVEHAPYDHSYIKSDSHALNVEHLRYDHAYHDDVDHHTNGDHRSYSVGNSETHV